MSHRRPARPPSPQSGIVDWRADFGGAFDGIALGADPALGREIAAIRQALQGMAYRDRIVIAGLIAWVADIAERHGDAGAMLALDHLEDILINHGREPH